MTYVQEMMEREIRDLVGELGRYIAHGEEPPEIESECPTMFILVLFNKENRKTARYLSNCEREDAATILEDVAGKLRAGQVENL